MNQRETGDLGQGSVGKLLLRLALPTITAQLVNALYNMVDRIYIGHIPVVGRTALTGVGVCMSLIMIISAFAALTAMGGATRASIFLGRGDRAGAEKILGNCVTGAVSAGLILTVVFLIFSRPLLMAFGASEETIGYAVQYMKIYALGTVFVELALGLNAFINAQGYSTTGMLSVIIGAVANLVLDPLFIFVFRLGVSGAAIATILSQLFSAVFVLYFLRKKADYRVRFLTFPEIRACGPCAANIVSLGTAGFIMQLTNSLVSICCNSVLSVTGGDIYISVMTIISSIRQMVETPIHAMTEGSSPIISYNYGARRPDRVRQAGITMAALALIYTLGMWLVILFAPHFLISIFSSDESLLTDTIPAMKLYFSAFIFMLLQYVGQTMFKSLGKKKQAVFFSLLRKVIIVVPLTYLFPYGMGLGTNGVFLAEPVSNVIGGSICFFVMLATVLPELRQMR